MTVRKTIRILGISLALIALLVFATGVVSDWHHSDSTRPPSKLKLPCALRFSSRLLFCLRRKKLLQPRVLSSRKSHHAHRPLRKQKDLSLIHIALR